MTFAAVIFDLDGTLIDTERLAMAAGHEAMAAIGRDVAPDFFHQFVGKDDATTAGLLMQMFPDLDLAAFHAAWHPRFMARLGGAIPLKAGAEDLLSALALPKALATSSTRAQADRKLASTGLARHFGAVVTFDDVRAPKPAPEPFLRAARLLGVDPAACVAFEDSETGARAAMAAGMTVVQVPDVQPTRGEHAHHVAADLLSGARAVGLI